MTQSDDSVRQLVRRLPQASDVAIEVIGPTSVSGPTQLWEIRASPSTPPRSSRMASGPISAPASTKTWSPIQQGAISLADDGRHGRGGSPRRPAGSPRTPTRAGVRAEGIQAKMAENQPA